MPQKPSKEMIDTSCCPPGFTAEPGHRLQKREYNGPNLKCLGIDIHKQSHIAEIVLWHDKRIALGEQTKENIAKNSKLYRVCHTLLYIETYRSDKGIERKKVHTVDVDSLNSLTTSEKTNITNMLK